MPDRHVDMTWKHVISLLLGATFTIIYWCISSNGLQLSLLHTRILENTSLIHSTINKTRLLPSDNTQYQSQIKILSSLFPMEMVSVKGKIKGEDIPKNCSKFPSLLDLKFNNIYWQELLSSAGEILYFLTAYYDNRTLLDVKPVVRIISVFNQEDLPFVKYCHLWFNKKLVFSNVSSAITTEAFPSKMHMYIITCAIPNHLRSVIPEAVSLVEHKCDTATNLLQVNHNVPMDGIKKNFAVCVKGLDYPHTDMSLHLIQWLELLAILEVDTAYIYVYDIHPNMRSVLEFYEKHGKVKVSPLTIPGTRPNLYGLVHEFLQKLHNGKEKLVYERIPHNDCFYSNMNMYKYIGIFDFDEIILPTNGLTWINVIDKSKDVEQNQSNFLNQSPSAYLFRGAIFTDDFRKGYGWDPDIPYYMSMLQNVYRTPIRKSYTKAILNTEKILGVSNHSPKKCIGKCFIYNVPVDIAYIAHFRSSCPKDCRDIIKDTNIWTHKEILSNRVHNMLVQTGLMNDLIR
ncbi:unnamed protein product [Meganyctiphanes norvegica]|uniref:Glycosyltransferase family 92 protein n=1 Tax=Meganyctiphanes norvegica TaxID=48144 RepID=A0AAV2RIL9_MEGNR